MKMSHNLLLALAVIALVALPLWTVKRPVTTDGKPGELFVGSDDRAKEMITTISPGYRPWSEPVATPPSSEVSSMLFATQAALGAGFIGYYLGVATTRARYRRDQERTPPC